MMKKHFNLTLLFVIMVLLTSNVVGYTLSLSANPILDELNNPNKVRELKHSALKEIALNMPGEHIAALVVFDNYYSKEEVTSTLNLNLRENNWQIRHIAAGIQSELVKGTPLEHFQVTFDDYYGTEKNYSIEEFYEFAAAKNEEVIARSESLYKDQVQEFEAQDKNLSVAERKEWEAWLDSISTTIALQRELLPKKLKVHSVAVFAPAGDIYNLVNEPKVELVDPHWLD